MGYILTIEEKIRDLSLHPQTSAGVLARVVLVCPNDTEQGIFGIARQKNLRSGEIGHFGFGFSEAGDPPTFRITPIGSLTYKDGEQYSPAYQSALGSKPGSGNLADGDVPHWNYEAVCPICGHKSNWRGSLGEAATGKIEAQIHKRLGQVAKAAEGATSVVKLEGGNIEPVRIIMP